MGDDGQAVGEIKRAENQLVFRETNEQIREVVDGVEPVLKELPVVCECSDPRCRRLLSVPADLYRRVRESPVQFFHLPDHANDGTSGGVVEAFDGFVIVQKEGAAAEVAEADRSGGVVDG